MVGWISCVSGKGLGNPGPNPLLEMLGLNLVLLQGALGLNILAWNFPSWSISVEFLVNLLLLYPIVRMRSVLVAAVLALSSWLVVVLTWGPVFADFTVQPVQGTPIAGGLLRGVGGILLGYLLYELYLVLKLHLAPGARAVWLATIFEGAAIALLAWCLWADATGWDLLPAPLSALLILQMATSPGHISRWLQGALFA